MNVKTQNETNDRPRYQEGFCSSITADFAISQGDADASDVAAKPNVIQLDGDERLRLAIGELRIGQRLQEELKRQGRTVTWLAKQLGMERVSLYYVFRRNSIDVELLLRISFHLRHNFLEEMNDVYKTYWQ